MADNPMENNCHFAKLHKQSAAAIVNAAHYHQKRLSPSVTVSFRAYARLFLHILVHSQDYLIHAGLNLNETFGQDLNRKQYI